MELVFPEDCAVRGSVRGRVRGLHGMADVAARLALLNAEEVYFCVCVSQSIPKVMSQSNKRIRKKIPD